MVAAGMKPTEPTLDQWMNFCERLTPYENFALIGLLFWQPCPPLSILSTSDIVTEENARQAEKWAESKFRQLLLFYCDKYQKPAAQAAAALIDKSDLIKSIVPLLVSTYSVPLGIAVAFLYWALAKSLDDWCQKYSRKKYNGKGTYTGNFPGKEVIGHFDVTYSPQITELVEDPEVSPRLEGYKIRVKVKSETNGRIQVPTSKELEAIQLHFTYDKRDAFDFRDTRSNVRLMGSVDNVSHLAADGPNILRFISSDMETESSKSA